MRSTLTLFGLLAAGVALIALAALPGGAQPIAAAPRAALTETAEPPTPPPTDTPAPTDTAQPALTPEATPRPTLTPVPPPTLTPTRRPQGDGDAEVADPAVTKAADPSDARIGDEIVFTLTVTNRGNAPALDVVVTDPLPDFCDILDVSASRGDIAVSGNTVVVTIGTVAPDEVITIRIRTRVNERAQPPGGTNTVTLMSSSSTDDPSNNSGTVTFLIQVPDPTVTPAAPPAPSATPAPTRRPPRRLPPTGAPGVDTGVWLLALLSLAAIGGGLLLRRPKVGR